MQSANAEAPAILAAFLTLGHASEKNVAFATLGLPVAVQRAAQEAARMLTPVAQHLASRKICTDLRLEMRLLNSSHSMEVSRRACWDSPHDILGGASEFMQLLFDNVLLDRRATPIRWRAITFEHLSLASTLARLNHAWHDAVCAWRREECAVTLIGPEDDAEVLRVVRYLSNVVELQLHIANDDYGGPRLLPVGDPAISRLAEFCPRLERLFCRFSDNLSAATLAQLLASLPKLRELDLASAFVSGLEMGDDHALLLIEIARHRHVRVTIFGCDALSEEQGTFLERGMDDELQQMQPPNSPGDAGPRPLGLRFRCLKCGPRGLHAATARAHHCEKCEIALREREAGVLVTDAGQHWWPGWLCSGRTVRPADACPT